jgi:hypothetical protein
MQLMTLISALRELVPRIAEADLADCPVLAGLLEQLRAATWARIMALHTPPELKDSSSDRGKYLTVEEVVVRFKVTPQWLYRHKKRIPHSQPSRKVLLFPEAAIAKWFASRKAI